MSIKLSKIYILSLAVFTFLISSILFSAIFFHNQRNFQKFQRLYYLHRHHRDVNQNSDVNKSIELVSFMRILCLVLTHPGKQKKAFTVKTTWGKRCNVLLFLSNFDHPKLPIVKVNVSEDYYNLWTKIRFGFKYAYQHYHHQYDWVLKADDDTYVIIENLKLFLSSENSSKPLYFGCKFRPHVNQGYMSGGNKV